MISLGSLAAQVDWKPRVLCSGQVCAIRGSVVSARIPMAALGDLCYIEHRSRNALRAQVVSFYDDLCCLAPFDSLEGITPGARIHGSGNPPKARLHGDVRGKILDALGAEIKSLATTQEASEHFELPIHNMPPRALDRRPIETQLVTGIRAIDGLCPIGYGQRMGIFASAGVGKSTLLGMIARQAKVDVSVIALVGERGREVQDFVQNCLGMSGLARSVVVIATSDESPLRRLLAPKTATAIAEYYRDQGLNVLLLVDSLTRTARAIRDVELSAGEIPVRQGYTAGVYTELPRLLERAGTNSLGSITALYTVLTALGDEHDALADEIKSILDGHLVLDPRLAQTGLRPAIDPLASISRLQEKFLGRNERAAVTTVLLMLSRLSRDRDILLLGGSADPELRAALTLEAEIRSVFTQSPDDCSNLEQTLRAVSDLASRFYALRAQNEATQP